VSTIGLSTGRVNRSDLWITVLSGW